MSTLYLDLFSGISGDMFLGAMIDLGVDAAALGRELAKLKLDGYHLHAERRVKAGFAGVKFDVHLEHAHTHEHEHEHAHAHAEHRHAHHHPGDNHQHHPHGAHHHGHDHSHDEHRHADDHAHAHHHHDSRTCADIRRLIDASGLSSWVKERAVAVFERIAAAEGRIHGKPPAEVHFHEVGAVDSIVDIVGACIALEMLGRPRVLASAVVEGTGWIDCAHGRMPVPAPATLAILGARGVAVTQCDEPHELVTPTGAALVAEFAESFGPMTGLVAERIGIGLGTRDNVSRANILRAVLDTRASTESTPAAALDWETDTVAVLETNLDNINAELLGQFVETALGAGAMDVFHTPIQMKKSRPGVLLTVLCLASDTDRFSELMLRETTALGVRRTLAERRKLRRTATAVDTPFGPIEVKLGTLNGRTINAAVEFESARRAAERANVPLKAVYDAALRSCEPLEGATHDA